MISRRPVLLLLAGFAAAGPLAADSRPLATLTDATRQKISALLGPRRHPAPLPGNPPNPFSLTPQAAGGVLPEAGSRDAAEPAAPTLRADPGTPPDTATLLARAAARLKIGGLLRLNQQFQIIVNDVAWKEGDYIVVDHIQPVVRLRIAQIQPGQLTLRLDDAELVIRF